MTRCAMEPIQEFGLEPIASPRSELPPRSRLVHAGRSPGVTVEGVRLEAQFRLEDGRYLLILSDDSPYEEQLHIYLLSSELAVQDALRIGGAYAPGILTDVVPGDGDRVAFSVAESLRYEVRVREKAGRRRLAGAPGVRRLGGPWRKRYLEIRKVEADG